MVRAMDDAGDGRRGLRPRVSRALSEAVAGAYGLSLSTATDLGGSANLNLLVRDNDERFVVRVYRRHVTDARLTAIQATRASLATGRVPCAEAVRAADGARHIRVGEHLVEVEPFVEADTKMDSLERIAAGLPTLGRMHDLLADVDVGAPADHAAPFANAVDPVGLVESTRAGTDRIRSWRPTTEEAALAEAADRLAEAGAEAHEPFTGLARQLVHGDFWDNNVLFRGGELVLVGDFDFMGERLRIDDLALTLFFTASLAAGAADLTTWRELASLVARYDAGTAHPLTPTERAALPVAVARQPLWSIAVWAAHLDDVATARTHLRGHLAAVQQGLAILAALDQYRDVLGS
jgi:Ser/Thr protein kinase RdoA (MazF antagonist)